MKILKKFGSFINEDLEKSEEGTIPIKDTEEYKTALDIVNRANSHTKEDETEEEEEDKYGKMLKELAEALATKVVKDEKTGALCVKYKGKTINVYSEDDKYHVDKKKFTSYQEVVNYLTGSKTMSKQEFRKEIGNMENTLDDMSNDLEEIEEDEEMLEEGLRDDMDMNPEYFDDEDDDFEEFDEDDLDEETWIGNHMDDEWHEEDDSDVCPSCDCNPCECEEDEDEELLTGERAGERRIGMDESHLTKRFKDFK